MPSSESAAWNDPASAKMVPGKFGQISGTRPEEDGQCIPQSGTASGHQESAIELSRLGRHAGRGEPTRTLLSAGLRVSELKLVDGVLRYFCSFSYFHIHLIFVDQR
jgi:hypothetical protein